MALVKCSECNSNVSDKARSCPKCGNPDLVTTVEIIQWKYCGDCKRAIEKNKDICSNCENENTDKIIVSNEQLYFDQSGNPREPYKWELKNAKESKKNSHQPTAQLMSSTNILLGTIVCIMLFIFWWYVSPHQQCLRENPKFVCDIAKKIR